MFTSEGLVAAKQFPSNVKCCITPSPPTPLLPHLSLSRSFSLTSFPSLSLQTSDLISNISPLRAYGTATHQATGSAISADVFGERWWTRRGGDRVGVRGRATMAIPVQCVEIIIPASRLPAHFYLRGRPSCSVPVAQDSHSFGFSSHPL